ncbi:MULTISPECIES: hypothetical protein [Burkholderia]|uniref:hypothetical protein n=1 Tax=Burkholderia TaxID=32008 RepID=UPI000A89827C|nr:MULTISPECIES: hypothetical protein [Burkholderia]VBO91404.1 Uncharacterised protein [Burkholderia pseudomallei]VBP00682.1 Uncharacterised protein [Burkholderia pseudomallei]
MATANSIATSSDVILKRLDKLLIEKSGTAWRLYNMLAFMVEALPEDKPNELPTRCALVELRQDMDQLATGLQCLVHHARHAPETGDE